MFRGKGFLELIHEAEVVATLLPSSFHYLQRNPPSSVPPEDDNLRLSPNSAHNQLSLVTTCTLFYGGSQLMVILDLREHLAMSVTFLVPHLMHVTCLLLSG